MVTSKNKAESIPEAKILLVPLVCNTANCVSIVRSTEEDSWRDIRGEQCAVFGGEKEKGSTNAQLSPLSK